MPASGQDTKCYSTGSEEPKINDKELTVFSMRFCPYAERVRLILNYKSIPYNVININLNEKPSWYLQRNPLGKVPTIQEPGVDPLFESLICAEYLDEKYPGKKILPSDIYDKARQKMLIEIIAQKVTTAFYAVLLKGGPEANESMLKGLDEVEKMLKNKYFAGEKLGFVDLMVWPWFERLPALKDVRQLQYTEQRYPKIAAWRKVLLSDSAVKETTYHDEVLAKFLQSAADGKANYDVGL